MTGPILILGATSTIARAAAASFAARGYPLYLAGRDADELERISADLRIRYRVRIEHGGLDAEKSETHPEFIREVVERMGGLFGILFAIGYLGDQQLANRDPKEALAIIGRNFTCAVSLLTSCAEFLERQKYGFIIGLSSVAGDRGRQSNYAYGSAKGGLSIYLQGLRNRLYPAGVRVITVKPGFVDTAMTFGMPGLFLVASPEYVGERIARAVTQSRDVVYVPWFWRYIMLIIRNLPENMFKRLKL